MKKWFSFPIVLETVLLGFAISQIAVAMIKDAPSGFSHLVIGYAALMAYRCAVRLSPADYKPAEPSDTPTNQKPSQS